MSVDSGYFCAGFTYSREGVQRVAPILRRWIAPGMTNAEARRALDATGFKFVRVVRSAL